MAFTFRELFVITVVFTLMFIGLLDLTELKENRVKETKREPQHIHNFNTLESWPLNAITENEIEPTPTKTEPFDCSKKVLGGTDYTIIYNVMPKTGSRTFTTLSAQITLRNGIGKHKEGRSPVKLTPKNQTLRLNSSLLKSFYQESSKDAVFIRGHNVFVLPWESNFVFLNTIREPIPWMISLYYFARNGDGKIAMGTTVDDTSFDECVARNLSYCVPEFNQYLKYFCGDSPLCRTHEALSISKSNFDSYLVVGLTEELRSFIQLIEILLPDVYGGILADYDQNVEQLHDKTRTKAKQGPLDETVRNLKERRDVQIMYEFYNFVKRKFHRLHRCVLGEE